MQTFFEQEIPNVPAFDEVEGELVGGVCIASADVSDGVVLNGGTPVGKDENGLYHVIKQAKAKASALATDTTIVITSDNQFKVGEFIATKAGAKSATITAIVTDTVAGASTLTIDQAIGAVAVGDILIQAKLKSNTCALVYDVVGLTKEAILVKSGGNHFVGVVLIGIAREWVSKLTHSDVKTALKGVIFLN